MSEHEKVDETMTMWSGGAHTVLGIEVQAVRLWANKIAEMATARDAPGGKEIATFLRACASDDDKVLVGMLMAAKESELQAGRAPVSAEPILQ